MSIPDWWQFFLLVGAAWRVFSLLSRDDLLDRPRRYVTRVPATWKEGDAPPLTARYGLIEFLQCPACFGFWVALAWWGAWQAWPHGTLVVAVPFALSAGLIAVQRFIASDS